MYVRDCERSVREKERKKKKKAFLYLFNRVGIRLVWSENWKEEKGTVVFDLDYNSYFSAWDDKGEK